MAKSNRWFSVLAWFHRKTTGKKIRTLSFFISLLMTPPRYTTTLPCSHAHMPKSCIVIGMWLGHFNLFHGSWYWADERRNTPAVVRTNSVVPTSATLWRGVEFGGCRPTADSIHLGSSEQKVSNNFEICTFRRLAWCASYATCVLWFDTVSKMTEHVAEKSGAEASCFLFMGCD